MKPLGGNVANVRYPVCPGIVGGALAVKYFFDSFGTLSLLFVPMETSSSVFYCIKI